MFNKNDFFEKERNWWKEQINAIDNAKKERLNRALEHYNSLLQKIGFSDFKVELSLDNHLQNLHFAAKSDNSFYVVDCSCLEEGDVIYFDIPDHIEDILRAIKCSENRNNEEFVDFMIFALKRADFYSIRKDFRMDESASLLSIIASKMNRKYELHIKRYIRETKNTANIEKESTAFDNMDGHQFERFCATLLSKRGYEDVVVTQGSGDQGVDIIAYKDGVKYGVQCKCYSSAVGNKAIQEIFSGKVFHHCHVGIVITNNFFTDSAIELATQNGIVLWDRNKLIKMISEQD